MQCLKRPEPIGVGYAAQYIIKPLLGFLITKVECLPESAQCTIWLAIGPLHYTAANLSNGLTACVNFPIPPALWLKLEKHTVVIRRCILRICRC